MKCQKNQWYLVAMEDSIHMLGYINIYTNIESKNDKTLYSFEYHRGDTKCTIYFDEKNYHGLYAWVLDKDLF